MVCFLQWAAGLETVPVLKRWGFKGAFSWGIASAFYDTSRPVYEGSLELNAMLVTGEPSARFISVLFSGAVPASCLVDVAEHAAAVSAPVS